MIHQIRLELRSVFGVSSLSRIACVSTISLMIDDWITENEDRVLPQQCNYLDVHDISTLKRSLEVPFLASCLNCYFDKNPCCTQQLNFFILIFLLFVL